VTERSSDIEFDFFDEPVTQEASVRERQQRRGPRPPVRPPAGFTPLVRLVGLIAFAILLVVLLVFWAQSCRDEGKRGEYRDYMTDMRDIARDSQQLGRELSTLLTTPGIEQEELDQRLGGLAQQQEQGVARASELVAPARLREQHRSVVDALQFRVSGVRRLQDAFRQTAEATDGVQAGQLLAAQAQRLLASDVIWNDLFREPAVAVLRSQDIGGVEVPASIFVANTDLATQRGMTPIWQRIRGASTGGEPSGTHGHGLVSVVAQPDGQQLRTDQDNTVTATRDLSFEATVENQGESQEVQVRVRLTVQQSPSPIVRRATIQSINPRERKTVVFRNLGQIVQFAQKTQLKVQVEPVEGERFLDNNAASYPVIFTLPPPD
jgi:hypothetical protein